MNLIGRIIRVITVFVLEILSDLIHSFRSHVQRLWSGYVVVLILVAASIVVGFTQPFGLGITTCLSISLGLLLGAFMLFGILMSWPASLNLPWTRYRPPDDDDSLREFARFAQRLERAWQGSGKSRELHQRKD